MSLGGDNPVRGSSVGDHPREVAGRAASAASPSSPGDRNLRPGPSSPSLRLTPIDTNASVLAVPPEAASG
jgi:hypothetical protein